MVTIKIAEDFSIYPGGRYVTDGPNSGERFREELLLPSLAESKTITIILDGTKGYPSSFLEEAFGGIVREKKYSAADLHNQLIIKAFDSAYERYVSAIWRYIDAAAPAAKG